MGTARDLTLNVKQVLHKNITFASPSGTPVSMGKVPANAVITAVEVLVNTAFNAGTTNVLIVGTAADDDAYLAAGDVNEAATGYTRYTAKGGMVTAETEILVEYTQSGTAATAGDADVIVEFFVVR